MHFVKKLNILSLLIPGTKAETIIHSSTNLNISTLDLCIIVIYLTAVTGLGIRLSGRQTSPRDYFLGGKNLPWWAVCLSVVATETSTLTFISIPGLAYISNLGFLQIALGYIIGRIFISFAFLPAYYRGELYTSYELLRIRFGPRMQSYASFVFQMTRLLADGVRLFATAIPLSIITGWNYPVCIVIIAIFTIIYTSIGGIRSVVWMDVLQTFTYIAGAIIAGIVILNRLPGGLSGVLQTATPAGKFHIFTLGLDKSPGEFFKMNYTLFSGLIGGAFLSMASHGTDQLIVQRLLTCKNVRDSRKALITSGFLIFAQFALFLFLGIMLFVFYHGANMRPDEILVGFIIKELPRGLAGLIVAAIFAAAMSTLSSSLNSLASSSMFDIFIPSWGKNITPKKQLVLSRLFTIFWGSVFIFGALLFKDKQNPVVELGLAIASFTYGGLLGTFFLGTYSKTTSEDEALVAMWSTIFFMTWLVGQQTIILWVMYGLNLLVGFWIYLRIKPGINRKFLFIWLFLLTVLIFRIQSPGIAWPWFVFVGSILTYLTGSILGRLRQRMN